MYKDKTLLHILYVKKIYTMHHTSNKTESTNYVLFERKNEIDTILMGKNRQEI
jgi:hypothetical protein